LSLSPSAFEKAAAHARTHVLSGHIPCALVAVGNRERLLAIRCFDEEGDEAPLLQSRIFALASITKAITGVGIARLVDEGRLRYTDAIVHHIPEFGVAEWRKRITIGDIFTHSTGLPTIGLDALIAADLSGPGGFNRIFEGKPAYEPGTRMAYTTLTYQLLNEIVARRLGTSMSSFLRQYVFEPCGMTDTSFEPTAPSRVMPPLGHPMNTPEKMKKWSQLEVSGSGLWSTTADLMKLAQALLQPGRLMSPATFRLHTDAQPSLPFANGQGQSRRTLGWNKEPQTHFPRQPQTGFYHGGATGTLLWLDPDRDLIFVFLTNRWNSGNDHCFAALNYLYEA